jgi:hypothetical protein
MTGTGGSPGSCARTESAVTALGPGRGENLVFNEFQYRLRLGSSGTGLWARRTLSARGTGIRRGQPGHEPVAPGGGRWIDVAREIKNESGLKPLRLRPEFQKLMLDVAFPADPFALAD